MKYPPNVTKKANLIIIGKKKTNKEDETKISEIY